MLVKSIILLIIVINQTNCYFKVYFESGKDQTISWVEGEKLAINEGPFPRNQLVPIKFEKEFPEPPLIMISTTKISWGIGATYTFEITPTEITTTGFVLKYTSYTAQLISQLSCEWLAIFDPRISIIYFSISTFTTVNKGTGERSEVIQIPFSKQLYDDISVGVLLVGAAMKGVNPILFTELVSTASNYARISVVTNNDVTVNMLKFAVMIGPRSVFWSSPILGYRAKDYDQWITRTSKNAFMGVNYRVPTGWKKWNNLEVLGGVNGFEGLECDKLYFRVEVKNEKLTTTNELKADVGTWSNSKLREATTNLLVYQLDEEAMFLDHNCVELFSECNFKGKIVRICEKKIMEPIKEIFVFKSILVPIGKVFRVYENSNKSGMGQTFKLITTCIQEGIKFSAP